MTVIAVGNRRPRPGQPVKSVASELVGVGVGVAPARFGNFLTPGRTFIATPALNGALSRRVWQPPTREAPSY